MSGIVKHMMKSKGKFYQFEDNELFEMPDNSAESFRKHTTDINNVRLKRTTYKHKMETIEEKEEGLLYSTKIVPSDWNRGVSSMLLEHN